MYRVLSIEDDKDEEARIREHLASYAQERGIELRLDWQGSAFELVGGRQRADVILLDIDLPGINGMDAAAQVRARDAEVPIVFVTNLAQFAIKGYEVDALGFVVKPVRYGDLRRVMDKALRQVASRGEKALSIPTPDGFLSVRHAELLFVEVSDHVLAYHLADGREVRARGSIGRLEESLAGCGFVRVSNSHLANVRHIAGVSGMEVRMDDGSALWFSRSRRKAALQAMEGYLGGSL